MDVHCTTCGEPWDVYHLRQDAIYETDLSHAEAKAEADVEVRIISVTACEKSSG